MNNTNIFSTTNRHLEQFLYMHRIHFHIWNKSEDGCTTWHYHVTDELTEILNEYRDLYPHKFVS